MGVLTEGKRFSLLKTHMQMRFDGTELRNSYIQSHYLTRKVGKVTNLLVRDLHFKPSCGPQCGPQCDPKEILGTTSSKIKT